MKRYSDEDPRVTEFQRHARRVWTIWGLAPLGVSTLLVLVVSQAVASPENVDPHILDHGLQAVLAISAGLFLAGFYLDGRWTNSERLARSVFKAAGGDQFVPSRTQLAAQADGVFKAVSSSLTLLVAIGAAIAVSAVISSLAGLGLAGGVQILIVGVAYQLYLLSRFPYYQELLSAAAQGELVVAEADANHPKKR